MKLSEKIRKMGFQNPAGQIVVEAGEYNEVLSKAIHLENAYTNLMNSHAQALLEYHVAKDAEASARAIMQKFVDKVDSGLARSTETYAEMKQWMEDE